MTLKELAALLPTTAGRPKPGKARLQSCGARIIAQEPTQAQPGGEGIFVYENGFILYRSGRRSCVLRIDDCLRPYTYHSLTGARIVIPLEIFLGLDWRIRIILAGEDRIERNRTTDTNKRISHFTFTGGQAAEALDPPDQELQRRVRAALTIKQRKIYDLYYVKHYTVSTIGRLEGISPRAVLFYLERIKKRIVNIL